MNWKRGSLRPGGSRRPCSGPLQLQHPRRCPPAPQPRRWGCRACPDRAQPSQDLGHRHQRSQAVGRRSQAGEGGLTSGQIFACCQIKHLPLKRGVTCLPGASSTPWSEPLPGPGGGTHTPLGVGCLPAWLLKAPSQEHAQARKYLFWGVARETVHLPQGCPCAQTGMPPALTVLGPHKHGQSKGPAVCAPQTASPKGL